MKKRFSWLDIILIFWAYFMGILIASELFNNNIINISNTITQGIIAIIFGFALVYFIIKMIDKLK